MTAEVSGKLRHDRWKDKGTGRWTGKVFVAIDPGEGAIKSLGKANAPPPDRETPLPYPEVASLVQLHSN